MIKCLCKENVQDKYTSVNYIAGKEYEFTKERAEEVTKTRYFDYVDEVTEEVVKEIVEESKETKPKRAKKSTK